MVYFECSVVGSVLIVIGLYSVLWGKHKENKEKKEREVMELPVALRSIEGNGKIIEVVEIDEVEFEKAADNNRMVSSLDQTVIAVALQKQDKAKETTQKN